PPSFFWWRTSQSIAGWTRGSPRYPNRTSMRAAFPVKHTSLPRYPRPPEGDRAVFEPAYLRRNRATAFRIRGFFPVSPRSARTRSLQFVETYFGRYSSNAEVPFVAHCPSGCCSERIFAAHPFLPISFFARPSAGSSSGRSSTSRRTRRRTLGSASFARSQSRSPRRRAMRGRNRARLYSLKLRRRTSIDSYGATRLDDRPALAQPG